MAIPSTVRSVDFLPEIFQTPVNTQFLNATLDQLIQEPEFIKTQGFVGRKVGPGVNPQDQYIIEPTASRNDYQLEPGVISLNPANVQAITDAITYPGINDALKLQGSNVDNASNLYSSEYYAWDPFVDFDKFINYAQYYWLPGGPLSVNVFAETIPLTDTFTVKRDPLSNSYSFTSATTSKTSSSNPTLGLVRGGNYQFNISQNPKETINYRVTNNGVSAYVINQQNNPALTLIRGNTYNFSLVLTGVHPFYIKTEATQGNTNQWTKGVTNNGASTGSVTFTVPQDAPDILFYCSGLDFNMQGALNIVNATAGDGPNFWIQTDPGINGTLPYANNISDRTVLGVTNNGIDLGTVSFNVPLVTAQNFYYNLTEFGSVDFATELYFDQINNVPLDQFIASYGGLDGLTNLAGKTLIFLNQTDQGWDINNLPVGFDSDPYAYADPIVDPAVRYGVWQISLVDVDGVSYITLKSVNSIANFEKLSILFGSQYANTQWYKNTSGFFEAIPLLTATLETLSYQDAQDPLMTGQFVMLDPANASTLFIADILGKPNYTSPNGVVFTNGLKVQFTGSVYPSSYQNNSYYVEGVGTSIQLLPVTNFVTPETYTQSSSVPYDSTPYDIGNYDASLNAPLVPDYLTINRASPDFNAWSRSNRWFHIDVIYASASYNNTNAIIDNAFRARRPILEFRAGTKLFNFGTQGKQPVDVIDFNITDALSTVNGSIGYNINGYSLANGSRVIFAADSDPNVRDQIYVVEFITPDTVEPLIPEPIINLVPAADAMVLADQTVVCLSGDTLQGVSFWYDGLAWYKAQEKTKNNQAPLFDVYDSNGVSFGDRTKYHSSTFTGCKLFSYAVGDITTTVDPVLGFPLQYLALTNVGDIVFDNNLYTDTFNYLSNSTGQTENVSEGFVYQYHNRIDYTRLLGWQTAVVPSLQRQQFQFSYDGAPLLLDVKVNENNTIPAVQLYVNNAFQNSSNYTYTTTDTTTLITLTTTYVPGDIIEVQVISDQVSQQGFYQIPINLQNNPLNNNSPTFTLGNARTQYETIGENLLGLKGPIIGANNSRDLGNIIPYGLQILQQSSPLTLAGYFMRSQEYNIFSALNYNDREYIKFKSLLMNTVITNDFGNMTPSQILDSAISIITAGKTSMNPFYWSDMLPTGTNYQQTINQITPVTGNTFNTYQTYNFTSANYLGLLVYYTSSKTKITKLLIRGTDYTVSPTGPSLTINFVLTPGDTITINEYSNTAGNFCPNTPTKMGLYNKFEPSIFVDPNYVNPTPVIQGHDGSITVAFGDIRDQVLLEFEKRIYNNIKTDGNPVPLSVVDVQPGFFRTTDYSQKTINKILGESFLAWVGTNKLDYKNQTYISTDPFTYNYSSAGNKINNQPLLGAWRGIYDYFYDTTSPNLTPWEMLGFSEMPSWWQARYGSAPYTSDNLVLWDDLATGYVADPVAPYINPKYVRSGLLSIIPNGTEGVLLNPLDSVVGPYDPTAFKKSWAVGDGGPVEASWWDSSSYPFAIMRLLALTKPAEFFALFVDRDLYKYDAVLGQYLYNGRYRLGANGVQVYGNGVSKASYINWIVDYNQQLGKNSTTDLTEALQNLDVRLCYRMASFSDKTYIRAYLERQSPGSTNTTLLLPDDSYNLLSVYKNQPFDDIVYSSLIVEQLDNGWSIYGYSTSQPYFNIVASSTGGATQIISAGGASVQVPATYTNTVVQVPYGYVFTNATMVVDFILSYGKYLAIQGLVFDDRFNNTTLDWNQMATEFLYFTQQGWNAGTIINLNPAASVLKAYRPGAVVDTIVSVTPENMLLDQNKQTLPTRDLIVQREGDAFSITSATNQTISYLDLRFTNYETMMVLDNATPFFDLIYDPTTGARQNRIQFSASVSSQWNGVLNAQGFILNQNNVKQWQANQKYTKGEIVIYKNQYWQALDIIQPSTQFDYQYWASSNYQLINQGLLPNLANKADQLANSYNINSANLESDNDLLAFGLIGYRPRQYMVDLNLDDVSQVNIYQQFLPTKGTLLAAEIFTRADLGKETGAYNIYENWGILAGTYGANANKSYFELRLNESMLRNNPSTVQVTIPGETSQADETILLENVWRQSYQLTSPDILTTTYLPTQETALPNAGYVNLNDVDITVFDLNDPSSIAANINSVGIGTTIWVAKSNSYDWNVYRCAPVPGRLTSISNNLNTTAVAQFSSPHGLAVGDLIVVKYFNDSFNGVYRVLTVPSITTITVSYSFATTNQTTITGTGLAFYLQTMRVSQASDVSGLPYANSLVPGAIAYVDNNGSGHWEVLQKQQPFSSLEQLSAELPTAGSRFGLSVGQTENLFSLIIGNPGTGSNPGSLYIFNENTTNNTYVQSTVLTLDAANVVGFGNSATFGKNEWAVVGASASDSGQGYATVIYRDPITGGIEVTQLLVITDGSAIGFGTSVSMSHNERWMYIGAPSASGVGKVYAYGRVDVELQTVSYLGDGTTTSFPWAGYLVVDSGQPGQVIVNLANVTARYGIDYAIEGTNIVFASPPPVGETVIITRNQAAKLDNHVYYNISQNTTTGSGTNAVFTVEVTRGLYHPTLTSSGRGYHVGDRLVINGTQIGGTAPANNLTITVTSVESGAIDSFTVAGSGVSTTTVFALNTLLYTVPDIDSFKVMVNGQIQRPNIDYTYNPVNTNLTFLTVPGAGAVIQVVSATHWKYSGVISASGLESNANFGISVVLSSDGQQAFIGADADSAVDANGNTISHAGSVYVFDRTVVRYLIENTTTTIYTIPGTVNDPIMISLNNQFLNIHNVIEGGIERTNFVNGQVDVNLDNGTITLLNNLTLTVGDVLEISTNQFKLMQKVTENAPLDESKFGYAVDICPVNCSLYVGAPLSSTVLTQDGSVERSLNQSRLYGVTNSTNSNPSLTAGDTIRINNIPVSVPASPNNNVAGLVVAINAKSIPNVVATSTPNVNFVGDGHTQIFYIGKTYPAGTPTSGIKVYVNGSLQTYNSAYSYDQSTQQILFVTPPVVGSEILVVSGRMTISVINPAAGPAQNLLTVLPGVSGTAFVDLGFTTFVFAQKITSPNPTSYAQFGTSLSIDTSAVNLVVGAANGNVYEPTVFDSGKTYWDEHSTTFFDPIANSGVVYTYDYLPSSNASVSNPGLFVFGQQIYATNLATLDQFGIATNFVSGRLLVGAPGNNSNAGTTYIYNNPTNSPAWAVLHKQLPSVDINLIDGVFMYNRLTSTTQTYFDFIDPLQGKILGVARSNIDYIGAVDPANYNQGSIHNQGSSWGSEHIGEIWWDTNNVRFINPNQDNLTYASRRWGQVFPGSSVDVYQWIDSTVPPVSYTGPGIPLSTVSYTTRTGLNANNIFTTTYYFWVRGLTTINTTAGKTLSTTGIASYILNPIGSGIAYVAPINSSTLAIYNGARYLSASDTILHVDFSREATTANIHTEYQLITDGRTNSFLDANLYRKLLDSFCGVDTSGAAVPDPNLPPGERLGVQFRPRQSMFADRFGALQNYLEHANNVLSQYPISESRSFALLNSSEPIPSASSGAWNFEVATLEELSYQNIYAVPMGYLYLVLSDSGQNGRWTIYQVVPSNIVLGERQLELVRIQNYYTPSYWSYITWYLPGYNPSIQVVATVATSPGLATLSLQQAPVGSSVQVTANGQGKWEIYQRLSATGILSIDWRRVALQDGTIKFSEVLWNYVAGNFGYDVEVFDAQYFDQEPVIETRIIIQAINEQLYVDDLAIQKNNSLILMFNYIYSENTFPDWLIKTSLIDVDHQIRALLPFQNYLQDDQTFVLNYINEVKPYHVQVRQFNLIYNGFDNFQGELTDFDVPAYYNKSLEIPQYVSPVLTPYTLSGSTVESTISDAASNAEIWTVEPYPQWFQNHLLSIETVNIVNGGSGYTSTPTVTVTGTCIEPAVMTATINPAGQVSAINIVNYGYGYSTTATITITGGNGAGAIVVAVMGNPLVRSIKTTIKYDRCEYVSTIEAWIPNQTYDAGTQVRYVNKVWQAISTVTSTTFNPADWTLVNAGTLDGANRTMGFYTPTANKPGLSLPLLVSGISYPGVQVTGVPFNETSGFSVANYDVTPFDNTYFGPSGEITYNPSILDAIYASYFGPPPVPPYPPGETDVDVVGGAYIDAYSSHAPEELVPGAEFDTLDMTITTTPGSDWLGNGHGFPVGSRRYVYDPLNPVLNFDGIINVPMTVTVFNVTQQLATEINAYDWANYQLTVGSYENSGDLLDVFVTGVGGGNQLYNNTYLGTNLVNGNTITVPFPYSAIYEFLIYNGETQLQPITDYTYSANGENSTRITFTNTYGANDRINLATFGYAPEGNPTTSWSLPVFETVVSDGNLNITLTQSLQGTNPVNPVVTVNGVRARPSEGIAYLSNGTTTTYALPSRGGYPQSLVADNDVSVYINSVALQLGTDFFVNPYIPGELRTVTLAQPATQGSKILISVRTAAQYWIQGNVLSFIPANGLAPSAGAVIEITTWNDTSEQDILTQVFVGPTTSGVLVSEGYDQTNFDPLFITETIPNPNYNPLLPPSVSNPETISIRNPSTNSLNGDAGSWDYSTGIQTQTNVFDLGTNIVDPSRLLVTLNGRWLFYGTGYTTEGTSLIILGAPISANAVLVVTTFTQNVVPGAMSFRIFQDMRGAQATYRITPETSTVLTQPLLATDDIIYVQNANALSEPDLAINIWGTIMVGSELVWYRNRDITNNTVSSLLRGTAGTATSDHAVGTVVTDMGRGNLLNVNAQNYIDSNNFLANGTTTSFTANNVVLSSSSLKPAVQVYVGGFLQTGNYTITGIDPVTVEFAVAPPIGVEVLILVKRGVTWYDPGAGTASNGVPLQDTNNPIARFLRGL